MSANLFRIAVVKQEFCPKVVQKKHTVTAHVGCCNYLLHLYSIHVGAKIVRCQIFTCMFSSYS